MNNEINDKTYIPLTPFKGWVLENFPFIEADFDCITNYQLLCKITEYLNNVISNQNQVQELGTELVNGYNNVVDYINDFFDNLSLQNEVNNKLDDMIESGELQSLLDEYVNIVTTFSKIGFLHGEENATYNLSVLSTLMQRDKLPTIYVDGTYYFNNSNEVVLNKSLRLIGLNGKLIFTNTQPLLKLDENSEIYFENITFNETGGEFYIFNANFQYTKKLNSIIINNCTFNNVSLIRADLLEEYSTSILSYGYDKIVIKESNFNNNKLLPIILQNVPCELIIENNNIKNMYTRFCVFGITNDNTNGDSFREVMNLRCNYNTMINDDDFYSNISTQYHTFIFTKCGNIECIGNYIENIAVNEEYFENDQPVETFGMYLLSTDLKFSDNTFKNIYNFAYLTTDGNTKIEVMSLFPNIKGYGSGTKELNNNTFILEESWLSSKATHYSKTLADLKSIPVVLIFNNNLNIKMTNNFIDSYFGYWSYKSYSYLFKNFIMENNIYNIKNHTAHVNSYICTCHSSENIIIRNNKFNIDNNNKILSLLYSDSGETNTINNVTISNNEFNINTSLYAPCLIQTSKDNTINSLNVNDNVINIRNGTYNANYTLNVYNYNLFNFINNKINCNYSLPLFRIGIGNGILNVKNKYFIKNIYSNNSTRNRLSLLLPLYSEKQLSTSKLLMKISKNGMNDDYDGTSYIKVSNDSTYNILTSLDSSGNEVQNNLTSSTSGLRIYDSDHNTMLRGQYTSDIGQYTLYTANDFINNTDDIIELNVELSQIK